MVIFDLWISLNKYGLQLNQLPVIVNCLRLLEIIFYVLRFSRYLLVLCDLEVAVVNKEGDNESDGAEGS